MDDDEARWTGIFNSHPVAGEITPARVMAALNGFPLELQVSPNWLARAIQPAVYSAAQQAVPTRGPVEVRDELAKLAESARDACMKYFHLSSEAQDSIWYFARSLPDASDATANEETIYLKETMERLTGAMRFLGEAAAFADAQLTLASQKGGISKQWARSRDKNLRMWFAVWLSPAYEIAFNRMATLNNPNRTDRHPNGDWADFYERMWRLSFPGLSNTRETIAEAGKIIRKVRALAAERNQSPATIMRFYPGWMPKEENYP